MQLKVRVHLNSSKLRLSTENNLLHAYLTSPPENGKANKQLLSLLKKKHGSCKIVSGKTSRNKIIETIKA
jgi:uncharacterized protein (TIGR00251 family)